jgi:hypothetical protein
MSREPIMHLPRGNHTNLFSVHVPRPPGLFHFQGQRDGKKREAACPNFNRATWKAHRRATFVLLRRRARYQTQCWGKGAGSRGSSGVDLWMDGYTCICKYAHTLVRRTEGKSCLCVPLLWWSRPGMLGRSMCFLKQLKWHRKTCKNSKLDPFGSHK